MIIRQDHLEGIRQGRISLTYRKWRKPNVKKGTLMHTAIGRVEILDIVPVSIEEIDDKDAIAAGQSLSELKAVLNAVEEGKIYRISLQYHSPDPRLELRSRTSLSEDDFSVLRKKLQRLDSYVRMVHGR